MWLIALAIPMQGMAAVVMLPCPPALHTVAPGASDRFADDRAADSAMVAAATHSMHIDVESADRSAASEHQDSTTHGESDHADHGVLKCCSATFSMAAVTTPSVVARTQLRLPAPLHPLAQLYRDVTPDGLDRPPKLILA